MNCSRCQSKLVEGKYKCSFCGFWNVAKTGIGKDGIVPLSEISNVENERFQSGDWDYVLGGGFVKGQVVLIGGEPGSGKSTLSLQIAGKFPSLYISAEESPQQVKSRAVRIKIKKLDNILILDARGTDSKLEDVLEDVENRFVFLDSLPGLVGVDNDREALAVIRLLKAYAVKHETACIILDHVTKDDLFAGRMTLQHEVDATITLTVFKKPGFTGNRILSTVKNRHGPSGRETNFTMGSDGLTFVNHFK